MSGLQALRERIEASLPLTKDTRAEWKVRLEFWSRAAIHPELRKQQQQRFQSAVQHFEKDICEAVAAGEIESGGNTVDIARRLLNMIRGISIAALHNGSLYSRKFLLR